MESYLIEFRKEGYLLFTINRPDVRNAVNYEIMKGLKEAIAVAKADESIKALVITGAGEEAFCSGGDLSVFHQIKTEHDALQMLMKMGDILYELCTLPKPTIALVNGAVVGGGCEILMACDFRLAKRGIKLGFVQGNLAITTGWGGASMAYEKFPSTNMMRIFMESSKYTSEQWFKQGIIQHLFDENGINECELFLQPFLEKEIGVLKAYKVGLINRWEHNRLKDRMEEEIKRCAILWESETHHMKVEQFRNKDRLIK